MRNCGLQCPSVADLLCLLHTLSVRRTPGTERNFLREGRMTFPCSWREEIKTQYDHRRGRSKPQHQMVTCFDPLSSYQWEYTDRRHQSSWSRCNQCIQFDVYTTTAELPEEAHTANIVSERCRAGPAPGNADVRFPQQTWIHFRAPELDSEASSSRWASFWIKALSKLIIHISVCFINSATSWGQNWPDRESSSTSGEHECAVTSI